MLLRRLRGLVTSMLVWAGGWAVLGESAWIAYRLGLFGRDVFIMGPPVPGGLPVAFALAGAVVGAINGAVFGGLLMIAERRRGIGELRALRVGLWGALATGATVAVLGAPLVVAGITGAVGFGVGAAMLRLAQRDTAPRVIAAESEK